MIERKDHLYGKMTNLGSRNRREIGPLKAVSGIKLEKLLERLKKAGKDAIMLSLEAKRTREVS